MDQVDQVDRVDQQVAPTATGGVPLSYALGVRAGLVYRGVVQALVESQIGGIDQAAVALDLARAVIAGPLSAALREG